MDIRNVSVITIVCVALVLTTGVCAKMFSVYECVDETIVVNADEEYSGSTVETACIGESSCGYNDRYAVWHSYTPESNQTVTISLCGSAFDTTLAVYDACEDTELACNNDCCDLQSELTINLTAGQACLIRVAGNDGQIGDYTLTITETIRPDLDVCLTIDNLWMYQNMPGETASRLTASVSAIDDPISNSGFTYQWEFVLPADVNIAPAIINGGSANDAFCTFAAPDCNQPKGLSDAGLPYKIRVIVTGNDYGNTGTAEVEFGILLLGDINNDTFVNLKDRQMANDFWQEGSATGLTLRNCDVSCDGVVNPKDRSIINDIWQGVFGWNSVSNPCPFR